VAELKKNLTPLPEPHEMNHCVDVFSKWRGNYFYIMQKYKSPNNGRYLSEGYETGLARLEYYGEGKFHLAYFRHTGQWWTISENITTEQAIDAILKDPWFEVF
jgi:hypothetical protein